jgi:hypothetical protein
VPTRRRGYGRNPEGSLARDPSPSPSIPPTSPLHRHVVNVTDRGVAACERADVWLPLGDRLQASDHYRSPDRDATDFDRQVPRGVLMTEKAAQPAVALVTAGKVPCLDEATSVEHAAAAKAGCPRAKHWRACRRSRPQPPSPNDRLAGRGPRPTGSEIGIINGK